MYENIEPLKFQPKNERGKSLIKYHRNWDCCVFHVSRTCHNSKRLPEIDNFIIIFFVSFRCCGLKLIVHTTFQSCIKASQLTIIFIAVDMKNLVSNDIQRDSCAWLPFWDTKFQSHQSMNKITMLGSFKAAVLTQLIWYCESNDLNSSCVLF